MIVIDTNVLSELLRPAPEPNVVAWVALLPCVQEIFDEDFAGQVLTFDSDAADSFAAIASERRMAGRPISQFDAMVAAVARSRGASLATRNGKDFVDCGVSLIDPWSA